MSYLSEGILDGSLSWFNEPKFQTTSEALSVVTSPDTDFWQRTHYGFRRDNGHCLLKEVDFDFLIQTNTRFEPKSQYDQCGLIVRIDSENWIKSSTEFETIEHSRLGSVVTNLGYSDWATIDIHHKISEMSYRIQSKGGMKDFLLEYSPDGKAWKQLRIAHLHTPFKMAKIGIYACSPMNTSFSASFSDFTISDSKWK
jgi:regulation of enolase protein 1 (concanavalin A-like superfamily)